MSMTEDRSSDASAGSVDTKLEVLVIPISDVDRAKESGFIGLRLPGREGQVVVNEADGG
jgi:hypothetical protein